MTSKVNHDGGQEQHRMFNIHNLLQTPQLQPQNFSINPLPYNLPTEPYQPPKLESYQPPKFEVTPKFELTKLTATLDESDSAAEDSRKLDTMCSVLKSMICQEGSSSASVHRFVETFEKISWNQNELEAALENFGQVSLTKDTNVVTDHGLKFANQTQVAADSFAKSVKVEPSFEKGDLLTAGSFVQSNLAFNGYGKENVGADIFDQINNIEIVKKKSPEPVELLPKVQPAENGAKRKTQCTPRAGNGKRARRVCGTCSACVNRPTTPDCQACNNCLDQKRYGGPGKLKKACIKRLCVLVLKPHEQQQLNNGQNNARSRSPPDAYDETSNSSTLSTASSGATRSLQPVSQPQQQQSVSDFSSITTNSTGQMVLSAPAYNVDSGTVSFTFAPMVTGAGGTPVYNIIPNINTTNAGVGNTGYAPAPTGSVISMPSGASMSMPTMSMPSGPTMSMPVFATQVSPSQDSQEQRVLDCREF